MMFRKATPFIKGITVHRLKWHTFLKHGNSILGCMSKRYPVGNPAPLFTTALTSV